MRKFTNSPKEDVSSILKEGVNHTVKEGEDKLKERGGKKKGGDPIDQHIAVKKPKELVLRKRKMWLITSEGPYRKSRFKTYSGHRETIK